MHGRLYQKGTSYIHAWDGKPKGVSMATTEALFHTYMMEVMETSTKGKKERK